MSFDIVIPCKSFHSGKSRLRLVLGSEARAALCRDLLRHTIRTALAVQEDPRRIHVVTADAEAAEIVQRCGADVIEACDGDLNGSISTARDRLSPSSLGMLVVPTDLPLLTPAAIRPATLTPAEVVVAPDKSGHGTNLLYLSSRAFPRFVFAFGQDSLSAHERHAERLGFSFARIEDHRLAFDLDDPEDYEALVRCGRSFLCKPLAAKRLGHKRTVPNRELRPRRKAESSV